MFHVKNVLNVVRLLFSTLVQLTNQGKLSYCLAQKMRFFATAWWSVAAPSLWPHNSKRWNRISAS